MSFTMTFLGSGAAIATEKHNFHSNVLLMCNGETMLLDAGTDVRMSLFALGYAHRDIDHVYISHQHFDHAGGLEWLALSSYFDPLRKKKMILCAEKSIIHSLSERFPAGLCTLEEQQASWDTYFALRVLAVAEPWVWQNIQCELVPVVHFFNNQQLMPSFGLFMETRKTKILFTSDTRLRRDILDPYYARADIIFHDCETSPSPSGIHAHYTELAALPKEIKAKMWLYHYQPNPPYQPEKDGFLGFVQRGQVFVF